MKCLISAESQRKLRQYLAGNILQMINDGKILNIQDLTREVYDMIYVANNDHFQALDYARLVPFMIDQLQLTDINFKKFLIKSDVSMNTLSELIINSSEDNGLDVIEDYLGLKMTNIKEEIAEANIKKKVPEKIHKKEQGKSASTETVKDIPQVKVGDTVQVKSIKGGISTIIEDQGERVLLEDGRNINKKNLILKKVAIITPEIKTIIEPTTVDEVMELSPEELTNWFIVNQVINEEIDPLSQRPSLGLSPIELKDAVNKIKSGKTHKKEGVMFNNIQRLYITIGEIQLRNEEFPIIQGIEGVVDKNISPSLKEMIQFGLDQAKLSLEPIVTDEKKIAIQPKVTSDRKNLLQKVTGAIKLKVRDRFKAWAPTFRADGGSEVGVKYNARISEEGTKDAYAVKRMIIKELAEQNIDFDGSELEIGGSKGVYLTAMNVDQVDIGADVDMSFDPNHDGILMVLTDNWGDPIRFDIDGNNIIRNNQDGGRSVYYRLKSVTHLMDNKGNVKQDTTAFKSTVDALQETTSLNEAEAKAQVIKEIKQIGDIRNHINKDKENNKLQLDITGGSLGYINETFHKDKMTPLSSVADNVKMILSTEHDNLGHPDLPIGTAFMTSPELYDQYIPVERGSVIESNYVDIIEILIFDQTLTNVNGKPLSWMDRITHLNKYINTTGEHFTIRLDKSKTQLARLYIDGTVVDLQNLKSGREVFQKFVETKNKLGFSKFKMNIHDQSLQDNLFQDVSISETGVITTTPMNHRTFLKENGFKVYTDDVSADGQIQRTNAYFTFKLSEEADKAMYPEENKAEDIPENADVIPNGVKKNNENAADFEGLTDQDMDNMTNELWDDPELMKNLDQKSLNRAVTQKQITEAKEWYKNHPLSNYIPFEAMFHKVNHKGVANWTIQGIKLYKGSDYSDLYHEAWHGFTQMMLTKDQKKGLYSEVKRKKGPFTDYNRKQVSFADATDKQIEEYLAEEFRTYMLKGQKQTKGATKQNSFFRKIWNVLKILFSNANIQDITLDVKADVVIGELFEKLRVGSLSEYSFSAENAAFGNLNQGITAIESPKDGPVQLSYQNSAMINELIDNYIAEFVSIMNSGLDSKQRARLKELQVQEKRTDLPQTTRTVDGKEVTGMREIKTEIKSLVDNDRSTYKFSGKITTEPRVLLKGYKYALNKMIHLKTQLEDDHAIEINPTKKALLFKDIKMISFSIKNFGTTESLSATKPIVGEVVKSVIGYHRMKSKVFVDTDIDIADEDLTDDDKYIKSMRAFDRAGNESSLKDLAKAEILYLLKTLSKMKKNDKGQWVPVLNRFGVTELHPFQSTWNKLARELQNVQNFDEMYDRLTEAALKFPVLTELMNRMGDPKASRLASEHSLWTGFWQTFNKTRVPLIQMTVTESKDKQGNVTHSARIGEAFNADFVVGKTWQSKFTATLPGASPYVNRDVNGNYMNLGKILQDFPEVVAKEKPFEFYQAIGFKLSDSSVIKKALLDNKHDYTPIYFHRAIAKLHQANTRVKQLSQITEDLSNRFKSLQVLEAKNSDLFSNFMVTNAEGNTQFEHTLNNSMTMLVNSINNAVDYNTMITQPHMSHLNVENNPFAEASLWMKSMFDLTGTKDTNPNWGIRRTSKSGEYVSLRLTNLSGVLLKSEEDESGDGISSASADEYTKLIMDLHLAEAGVPELMRHADKGTSFSITIDGKLLGSERADDNYVPMTAFAPNGGHDILALEKLKPHIIAEMKRMRILNDMYNDKTTTEFDFNYINNGRDFSAFDDVLSKTTKARLKKIAFSTEDIAEGVNGLAADINIDMTKYFNKQYDQVLATFDEASFVADNILSDVRTKGIPAGNAKGALIKSYVYNNWIHNIESIVLLYGDLAQYNHAKEEFHKRNAGAGSTGTIYRTDKTMQQHINNDLYGSSYAKANATRLGITEQPMYTGQMNTAIVEDMNVKSAYMKEYTEALGEDKASGYANQNEADAQGLITFDAYRQLKVAEGSWSTQHENLFKKIVKGEHVSTRDARKFFPVVKAQYWGPLANKTALPITAFHKYSLFPMVPTVIKDAKMEALHDKMVKENIGYLTFESGSKVGTITKGSDEKGGRVYDKIYGKNRVLDPNVTELNTDENHFMPNIIHLEYLKNQLEIHDERKGQVIFSTQLRKLIEDGLMENGVPTDYMPGKLAAARIKAWEGVKNKEEESKRYKLLKDYERNIGKLTQHAKDKLLEEINWESEIVNGVETLTGDISNLMNLVRSELTRQDLGQHAIDFIGVDSAGNLKHDLSLSLSVEQIEKLLNAMMVKKLVKQKVNGEGLIQVASTLMESMAVDEGRNFENPTEEDLAKHGSNDLPTYRKGKGKDGATSAMKVKVSLAGDFQHLLNLNYKGERIRLIETLNEAIKDEEWLNTARHRDMITMVGVRIPVQGLNSMEFMEVYEFLLEEAGSVIIPPTEIVTKSGADFDVDKMTVMMPNIRKAKEKYFQQITLPQMWNWSEKEIKENYDLYVKFKRENILGATDIEIEKSKILPTIENLFQNFFGTDKEGLDAEYVEMLIEKGDILTYDKFKKRQLGSKAIQNDIIGNIRSILELPENFESLITPNNTDLLDNIAVEMKDHVMDFNPLDNVHSAVRNKGPKGDIISPTRVLEVKYNLYKHASNNVGKQTLGLGAVDNTYNTLFNRIGAYMNATNMPRKEYDAVLKKVADKKKLTKSENHILNNFVEQKIMLSHNTVDINGEKSISLSHVRDAGNNNTISDVVNQLINGWVDIAKDAWIFNIQGNKEVAPVLLFMVQAGVPIKDAVYFVSNPLVREYVKQQKLAKSTFGKPLKKAHIDKNGKVQPNFYRSKARATVLLNKSYEFGMDKATGSDINNRAREVLQGRKNFTTKELMDNAKSNLKERKVNDTNKATFLHFLQLEDMTKSVRDMKMRTNVDTSKDVSLFEAQDRISMLNAMKADGRMPFHLVDAIKEDSPIGSFFIQEFQINLLGDAFPLRNHTILNKFIQDNLTQDDIDLTFGDKEKTIVNWKSDLISFVFQNELQYFNVDKMTHYKSTELKEGLVTEQAFLEYGAFVKEGKMYIDKTTLRKQFANQTFNSNDYSNLGLAKVNSLAFKNESEYIHFVLERETLRAANSLNSLKESNIFRNKLNQIKEFYKQHQNETQNVYDKRLVGLAYEEYLRDQALNKTFNHWNMFKGFNTKAHQFMIIHEDFPALSERFAIMNALSIRGKNGFKNLALNESSLDGDQINILHENLEHLTDPVILREVLPEVSQKAIDEIIEYFIDFPIVAFLQSGMNTSSMLALTSFVSQDKMVTILNEPLKNLTALLNSTSDLKDKYLQMYHGAFKVENTARQNRIRGKTYSKNMSLFDSNSITKAGIIEPIIDPMTLPSAGVQITKEGYAGSRVTINKVKVTLNAKPDQTFVYNYAIESQANATSGDHAFHAAGPNVIGFASLMRFSPAGKEGMERPDLIRDLDGKINPTVKTAIDNSVKQIIDHLASGQEIVFNNEGYGQEMISKNKAGSFYAPQTFLYLSKVLLENFEYLNPKYLDTRTGKAAIQGKQGITDIEILEINDQAVKDFMSHCLK